MADAILDNFLFYSNGTVNSDRIREALRAARIPFIEFESPNSEIAIVFEGNRFSTNYSIRAVIGSFAGKSPERLNAYAD